MTLLALNQQEILVKLPLKENYFTPNQSNYSASSGQRLLLLGIDNGNEFQLIDGSFLNLSERYMSFNPQFDFSIFQDSDFRQSGDLIEFLAPRQNSTPFICDITDVNDNEHNFVFVPNKSGIITFEYISEAYNLSNIINFGYCEKGLPLRCVSIIEFNSLATYDFIKFSNLTTNETDGFDNRR